MSHLNPYLFIRLTKLRHSCTSKTGVCHKSVLSSASYRQYRGSVEYVVGRNEGPWLTYEVKQGERTVNFHTSGMIASGFVQVASSRTLGEARTAADVHWCVNYEDAEWPPNVG